MQRFVVRRLMLTVVTVLAVSLIVFVMARAAGDPRTLLLSDQSSGPIDQWEELGKNLGLDKPYYQQYGIFLKDMVTGDFGKSIVESRPARDIIGERLLATMELGLAAFMFSALLGIPLGILGAVKRDGILDQIGKTLALIGQSAPGLLVGHHAHLLLCRLAGVGASFRPGRLDEPDPSNHHTRLVLHSSKHEARPLSHAGCAGLRIYQAGSG